MFLKRVGKLRNIAHNQALEENVFLMVICIELRIPLFLVGKPGSSKSLAKTIVADVMQGKHSRSNFYKQYKEVKKNILIIINIHMSFKTCRMFCL